MKKFLLIPLLCCLGLTAQADKYYGTVDGIAYYFDTNGNTAEVVQGSLVTPNVTYSGDIVIPGSVTYNEITFSVTVVGGNAFNGKAITSVKIPATVTRVGKDAFANCNSLTKASFTSLERLCNIEFQNANSNPLAKAHNLYIADAPVNVLDFTAEGNAGVTSIGNYAFLECTGLTSVIFSSNISSIGTDAFKGCTGLTKTVFASIPDMFAISFASEYANPLSLTKKLFFNNIDSGNSEVTDLTIETKGGQNEIYAYALVNASNMVKVTIPANITSIGSDAFKGCAGLVNANFSSLENLLAMVFKTENSNPLSLANNLMINGVVTTQIHVTQNVGERTFINSHWLLAVTFDNSVSSIGDEAFRNCSKLSAVNLPSNLTSIGKMAFYGCPITSVTLPTTLSAIGNEAFRECKFTTISVPDGVTNENLGTGVFRGCSQLKSATLPKELIKIPKQMFFGCSNLTTVKLSDDAITLPNGVTTIEESAFEGCSSLKTMPASNSLKYIEVGAFKGCTGFTNLVLTTGALESIYQNAFQNCSNITSVTLPSTLTNILSGAFNGCANLADVYSNRLAAPNAASDAFTTLANITLHKVTGATGYDAEPWNSMKQADAVIANHTLTFIVNDNVDTPHKTITFQAGLPVSADDIPNPDGIFSGWDKDIPEVMPSEDVTFYGYVSEKKTIDGLSYHLYPAEEHSTPAKVARAVLIAGLSGKYSAESIKVPASVTDEGNNYPVVGIGERAFEGCEGLYTINLDEAANLKDIGARAFLGCKKLIQIKIPTGVTVVSDSLFMGCTDLSQNPMHDGITEIGKQAFSTTKVSMSTLPANLTKLGWQAFRECIGLTELIVPNLAEMGREVFLKCSGLKKVTFAEDFNLKLPERTFQECTSLTDVTLRGTMNILDVEAFWRCSSLETLSVPEGITVIGNNAFLACTKLTTVTLPSTITTIGSNAFNGSALAQLTMNATAAPSAQDNTFSTYSITKVYIPSGATGYNSTPWSKFGENLITSTEYTLKFIVNDDAENPYKTITIIAGEVIDKAAIPDPEGFFSGWDREIPAVMPGENLTFYGYLSVEKQIGDFFYHLYPKRGESQDKYAMLIANPNGTKYSAETITIPAEVSDNQGTEDVEDDITYPVTTVNRSVFEDCGGIFAINVSGSNMKEIGARAFAGCKKLSTFTIPENVTVVSDSLFLGCTNLTSVELSQVTEIGKSAFSGSGITSISLPTGLKQLGWQAFRETKIGKVVIPASMQAMGDEVFLKCANLETVTFADGFALPLTERLFQECVALKNVTLSGNTESIGRQSFWRCTALETLTIPEGVKTIKDNAFDACSTLSTLTLSSTIGQIGDQAFNGCSALALLTVNAITPPTTVSNAFTIEAFANAKVYVPEASLTAYQGHDTWKKFTNLASNASYTLTYILDGEIYKIGETEQVFNKKVGETIDPMAVPTKEGHLFDIDGWKNEPKVMPAENVTVTGRFQYEVKYYEGSYSAEKPEENRLLADQEFKYYYGDDIVVPSEKLAREGWMYTLPDEMPTTMPGDDLNVVVNYLETDRDVFIDGITYRLFFSDNEADRKAELKKVPNTLANLTIPEYVTYDEQNFVVTAIQKEAAKDNTNLSKVTFGENSKLESIGAQAFEGCKKLTSMVLPASLKSIGSRAFYSAGLNAEVSIPAGVTELGEYVFYWCASLTGVSFAEGSTITAIPAGLFKNCWSITTMELPDGVISIGVEAFSGCKKLSILTLSNVLESVGDNAFAGCERLTSLTLPATVTELGNGAFSGCKLETVTVEGTSLPAAYETTFDDSAYDNATLVISKVENPESDPNWTSCWNKFRETETQGGTSGSACAKPVILYKQGALTFTCETEGATIVAEVVVDDTQKKNLVLTSGSENPNEVSLALNRKYTVTAYAIKDKMTRSAKETYEFYWNSAKKGDTNDDGKVTISDAVGVVNIILNDPNAAAAPELEQEEAPEEGEESENDPE